MKIIIFGLTILLNLYIFSFIQFANAQETIEITFDTSISPDGAPLGWKLKEKTGEADFKIIKEDNETVAYLRSVSSSFSLEKPLNIDPIKYPYISWKWKVTKLPLGGDVRDRKKNDQAAQLLVAFEGKKVISYVWDTLAPEGTVSDESIGWPINAKIKVITVKSGFTDLNKWISFKRNIIDDFQKLYDSHPPLIKGVRVQINSQHTKSIAEAFFGKILFSSK